MLKNKTKILVSSRHWLERVSKIDIVCGKWDIKIIRLHKNQLGLKSSL